MQCEILTLWEVCSLVQLHTHVHVHLLRYIRGSTTQMAWRVAAGDIHHTLCYPACMRLFSTRAQDKSMGTKWDKVARAQT